MSKQYPGDAPPALLPDEQLAYFVQRTRAWLHPAARARLETRVRELELEFSDDELLVLAALDSPGRVQFFLDTEVYYNNDHSDNQAVRDDDEEETAYSPRQVLRTGRAHCFEGALFAYMVDYLHGFEPRWMLLEGKRDVDHNLVVYHDRHAVRWGCNAHSGYPHLGGRAAEFYTLRALAESYYPHYYSGYTNDPRDITLVGYSEPFDLTHKFGVKWMASLEPAWDIYYTFVDDTRKFHRLFTDSTDTHPYPLIRALKEGWIEIQASGGVRVNVEHLPPPAQTLWHEFWEVYDPDDDLPRGKAAELDQQFFALTGTSPIDLATNAEEFADFLRRGYRVEQLLTGA